MVCFILCFFTVFAFLLLLKHGMLRVILDLKKETFYFLVFNSILSHNKWSLLEAYNTIHQYDILYISETYLDSSVSTDDTTLSLPGYKCVSQTIQCHIQQFFGGVGFSTSVARRKNFVQLGSMGWHCEPSPVGSSGKTQEIFGSLHSE